MKTLATVNMDDVATGKIVKFIYNPETCEICIDFGKGANAMGSNFMAKDEKEALEAIKYLWETHKTFKSIESDI